MFSRRIDLFNILGIPLRIDLSWFVIAFLLAWSLATGVFPSVHEGASQTTYWAMGIIGTLGLFVSVVLHELAHALVARRYGMRIRGITLFIFGGVAELDSEPPSPVAEFVVAIAGPLASLGISVGCLGLAAVGTSVEAAAAPVRVLFYLAVINLMLVVFNMIPAFPLDGGRVLRSALWQWKNDLRFATRVTSRIGAAFGVGLIAIGIYRVIARGDLLGGMWMLLIGLFLRSAAGMSYQSLLLRRNLEGEPVARFMKTDAVAVPRAASVAELVDSYIYKHHYKMFPVVDGERLLGCVSTHEVQALPREEWERQTVGSIVEPCSPENSVTPDSDALSALALMKRSGRSRLLVVDGDRLLGIIALKDLLEFLALKVELEEAK